MKQVGKVELDKFKKEVEISLTLGELSVLFAWYGKSDEAGITEVLKNTGELNKIIGRIGRHKEIDDLKLYQDMKKILKDNGVGL